MTLKLEDTNTNPVCPFCEKEIHTVMMKEIKSGLGKRYVYFCPHCKKIWGVSHRKGFFMG